MMESSITLGDAMSIVLFAIAVGGVWYRLTARFDTKLEELRKDLEAKALCHRREFKSLEGELTDFKLEAAEKYASVKHLKEVEGRLVVSIDRLADRIDRLLSRIDKQVVTRKSGE